MAHAIEYRRLRAPQQSGQALIDPPLSSVAEVVAENQVAARAAYGNVFVQGISQAALRDIARQELFAAALDYTRKTLGDNVALSGQPKSTFLLAGHQPELFHPGVWFKNFVLSSLAERLDATAINLIVDNDKAGAPSVRRPGKSPAFFDEPITERPYEERFVVDEACFAEFPRKAVCSRVDRLATLLWARMGREPNLGQRLAAARHRLECEHGLRTLEVPLSTVCETPSFAQFALHLLLDLPRLREVYNGALADYRRVHRVRSQAHPVPPLAKQGNWLEAPLWIWSTTEPHRRPVYVQKMADALLISDRQDISVELPLTNGNSTEETVEAWLTLKQRGIKLRPRALVTTMYARLLLSDLFLHGIGGAKYDQLTDAIIEAFFGIAPPQFMTVTATLKLQPDEEESDLAEVKHRLRQLPYHPEKNIDPPNAEADALRAEKLRLIHSRPTTGSCKAWHDAIVAVNAKLLPFTRDHERFLKMWREREEIKMIINKEFGSRELSFCLYPIALIEQLKQMATPDC